MRKTPIEVSGLRKAPAIVVNPDDQVKLGGEWWTVRAHGQKPGIILVSRPGPGGLFEVMMFHVDRIDEWRKG